MARDDKPKPSHVKGMVYVDHKPKFLQNAITALRGSSRLDISPHDDEQEAEEGFQVLDPSRPAIPTRPDDDPYRDQGEHDREDKGESDEEVGDEMPQIVVLKEGKHLSREQVIDERLKGAKELSKDSNIKSGGSLNFASSSKKDKESMSLLEKKRKAMSFGEEDQDQESEEDWRAYTKRKRMEVSLNKQGDKQVPMTRQLIAEKGSAQEDDKVKCDKAKERKVKKVKKPKGLLSFERDELT